MSDQQPSIPDSAVCLDCGYRLRGLSEPICPECGRPFDPADRRTYQDLNAPVWWRTWALPPPLWWLALLGVWLLLMLEAASKPYGLDLFTRVGCLTPLILLAAAMDFLVRLLGSYFTRRPSHARLDGGRRRGRWRWVVVPVLFLILILTGATNWPLRARFAMSRSALQQAATSYLNGTYALARPQWIGWYRVERIMDYSGEETVGFVTGHAFDSTGFVYDANAPRTGVAAPGELAPGWSVTEW